MKVIMTHTNADFDALAGMVACSRLYPGARLLFPGSIERNLRDYIELYREKLPEVISSKGFDFSSVDGFVLVDVAARQRLGALAHVVEGKAIDIFDHHPGKCDIEAGAVVDEESGAVTSIMTEILEKRGVAVTPFEATLFLLGIYEDTGFLTFPTTRPRDFDAAKRCLGWGADLSELSRWLHRRLSETQLRILTKMVENLESIVAGGVRIHLTTFISTEFFPDLSLLVHELLNTEDMEALFLVAYLESRVHIIARSRTPLVDVGKVLEAFGGGGHPSAASATVRASTLDETRRALVEQLLVGAPVGHKAVDFCQRDFARGSASMTIEEALTEMNKCRINALPVFDGPKVVGVVTRQEVDKTVQMKMGDKPVMTLVASPPPIFPPEAPVETVQRRMMEKNYRIVLVGDSEEGIIGLISRMRLFKKLYEKTMVQVTRSFGGTPSPGEITKILDSFFTAGELEKIKELGSLAAGMGMKCYLVGGVVRDILLHNELKDLDFVVEGDAGELMGKWAEINGGRVRVHSPFGTAIWLRPGGGRWDLATARIEHYETPAALPQVQEAGLAMDLSRRDFTINSMAISINPDSFGELIDPFGGMKDLRQSAIKVLHGISIIDDPTRAFRAVRFSAKLNFDLSPDTRQLIVNALRQGVFQNLSPKRVLSEMLEILRSPGAVEALKMLEELQILRFFWQSIKLTPKVKERLYRAQKVADFFEVNFPREEFDRAAFFLLSLTDRLSSRELYGFIKAYPFPRKMKELLATYRSSTWELKKKLESAKSDGSLRMRLLSSRPLILLLYHLSKCEREEEETLLKNFILRDRFVALSITGEDLKRAGLQPGEAFARALMDTKVAKMEGRIGGREEELAFAIKAAGQGSPGKKRNDEKR